MSISGMKQVACLVAMLLCVSSVLAAEPSSRATVLEMMASVNQRLEISGSAMRLTEASLHRLGLGAEVLSVPGIGSTWNNAQITYAVDTRDLPSGFQAPAVENVFVAAFESWNRASSGRVIVDRLDQTSANHDVLDAPVFADDGSCIDIVDNEADDDVLIEYDVQTRAFDIAPKVDIFVGGWLSPEYFSRCLQNADLLAITWTFSGPDQDGDARPDRLYVEQYFNDGFRWTTSASKPGELSAPIDLGSIVMHEIGHAHGLGHFGQTTAGTTEEALEIEAARPGQSFNPSAIMNPFYLGGEKRQLSPADIEAFRSLYRIR